jgi:hypothetical protein
MREECGKCDENEEHEALFVLPLLMFTAKKMVFFLLVFVFVRIKVCAFCVVAKPLLVKEVITERERERDFCEVLRGVLPLLFRERSSGKRSVRVSRALVL